jgi:uncharacterized protein (TIGR02186 family)
MRTALALAVPLLALWFAAVDAAEPPGHGKVQSDISKREVSIQSNFTGIEILIFGSIDFSDAATPSEGGYDVITVIRGPNEPIVVRKKQRVAGIWVNGPGKSYSRVPGFYAVLSSRPFRAITSDQMLKRLGIGLSHLDFRRYTHSDPGEQAFRSAMVRLREQERLFIEDDDGVGFIGRSLFRADVALPVNVPIGRYTADIYLFREGVPVSKTQSTLEVNQVGFERVIYLLAFRYPFVYGLVAVLIAVLAGLLGWIAFRRE